MAIRLTPGAKVDRVEAVETDAAGKAWLRVRIKAPPVDGKANAALTAFLAKRWRLPKTAVRIASGMTQRNKLLELSGDPEALRAKIEADL